MSVRTDFSGCGFGRIIILLACVLGAYLPASAAAQATDDVASAFAQAAKEGPQDEAIETAQQAAMLVRPLQPSTLLVPGTSPYQTAHLFGDWGGILPFLHRRGIYPFLNYLAESAGNPVGGMRQTGAYAHQVSIGADLDWYQIAHVKGLSTHFPNALVFAMRANVTF
ncbi:hypothetical protein [Gluconacetobacter diazotrophicus]|uniref:Uncharacterized protein n=2 Tax=Gluconacetobacter diazotrophicus TaxID=33996 RepID=A9H4Z6_GLUDA|nr:hypothetical protein [Gluconacetobacter diazotrophicus]CAP54269.1 conserved hypothetical protein [Gluconacetobacter diazotrophicus PA1 5]